MVVYIARDDTEMAPVSTAHLRKAFSFLSKRLSVYMHILLSDTSVCYENIAMHDVPCKELFARQENIINIIIALLDEP